jgi:hypothetical protein
VAGAAAGTGLGEWWCVGDGDGLAAWWCVGDGDGLAAWWCVGDGDGLALWWCLGLGLPLGVPLAAMFGVGETLAPGENEDDDGSAVGVPPVQADTAAEVSMVMVPTAASFALSRVFAMVKRTFMEPPDAPVPESAGSPARHRNGRQKRAMT